METADHDSPSDAHWVHLLKWPIAIWMMCTSVPAGFLPIFTFGVYHAMTHPPHLPSWQRTTGIHDGHPFFYECLALLLLAELVHGGMTLLAWRNWNTRLLGLRGEAWFVMAWCAFVTGVGLGIWIYSVSPHSS